MIESASALTILTTSRNARLMVWYAGPATISAPRLEFASRLRQPPEVTISDRTAIHRLWQLGW